MIHSSYSNLLKSLAVIMAKMPPDTPLTVGLFLKYLDKASRTTIEQRRYPRKRYEQVLQNELARLSIEEVFNRYLYLYDGLRDRRIDKHALLKKAADSGKLARTIRLRDPKTFEKKYQDFIRERGYNDFQGRKIKPELCSQS